MGWLASLHPGLPALHLSLTQIGRTKRSLRVEVFPVIEDSQGTIYEFSAPLLEGGTVSVADFRNRVLLLHRENQFRNSHVIFPAIRILPGP
jgi:hypothetical protein